jgi:hypothetical protein
MLGGPQSHAGWFGEEKNPMSLLGIKPLYISTQHFVNYTATNSTSLISGKILLLRTHKDFNPKAAFGLWLSLYAHTNIHVPMGEIPVKIKREDRL